MSLKRVSLLALLATLAPSVASAQPSRSGLDTQQATAFAARLEEAVLARLRLVPEADAALEAAASRCAATIAPIHARAYRDRQPAILGLPSGRVLISTGLIAALESDAELVSALAHEAGHVANEDLLDRLVKSYGIKRIEAIAAGEEDAVLAGMAANIAGAGLLVRHGGQAESNAEDAARRAGCEGGLATVFTRAVGQRRARRAERQAHPVPKQGTPFPGALDPAIDLLHDLRLATAPLP